MGGKMSLTSNRGSIDRRRLRIGPIRVTKAWREAPEPTSSLAGDGAVWCTALLSSAANVHLSCHSIALLSPAQPRWRPRPIVTVGVSTAVAFPANSTAWTLGRIEALTGARSDYAAAAIVPPRSSVVVATR